MGTDFLFRAKGSSSTGGQRHLLTGTHIHSRSTDLFTEQVDQCSDRIGILQNIEKRLTGREMFDRPQTDKQERGRQARKTAEEAYEVEESEVSVEACFEKAKRSPMLTDDETS